MSQMTTEAKNQVILEGFFFFLMKISLPGIFIHSIIKFEAGLTVQPK